MKKKVLSFFTVLTMLCSMIIIAPVSDAEVSAASSIEKAVQWAIDRANDNSCGYSQAANLRWGPKYYDCSSFVITALKKNGFKVGNATYTGNMRSNLTKNGFKWIKWSSIKNVSNLKRGDILLKEGSHTEFYIGNKKNVGAHTNKKPWNDQVSVSGYYYHPWDGVLRFDDVVPPDPVPDSKYFPKYTGSSGSIVEALKSIGVDSSMAYRKKIAAANGISNYTGTAAQNKKMLDLLKKGKLIRPEYKPNPNPTPTPTYFPKYIGSSNSIVEALKSIGADSSLAYRKKIAAANSISNYTGTAAQNTKMLDLLKKGKLIKPESTSASNPTPTITYFKKYTGSSSSIVEALKSIGADSSLAYRKKIAVANGISGYTGTAAQNTKMLSLLKSGKLIKP